MISFLLGHLSVLHIHFVGYKNFYNVLSGMCLDLFKPVFHSIERGTIIDWKDHYYAHSPLDYEK